MAPRVNPGPTMNHPVDPHAAGAFDKRAKRSVFNAANNNFEQIDFFKTNLRRSSKRDVVT